ncbi:MAG: GGDEF domain-containing protein [Rhodocyclales bacterium]|nr:GGDEF domain-containing protein [Rhodocyclales bacterium]
MNQLSTPRIVSMIAALTRHRDVSLLETSLLKTVADLFAPDWAAIFHIGDDDVPVFSTSLREGIVSQTDFPEPFSELIGTEGVTSFPIMSHAHKVLGYLLVHRQPQLSEEERTLMTELFRVYDNYLSVLRDSQVDRLTGLLNRTTFDDQLDRALGLIRASYQDHAGERSKRKVGEGTGSFFMGEIDIDHFKSVNDRFGHLHGDEVLIILARILQSTFRKSDLIYRFGGEEFVVIVYVDDRRDAELTFERLRISIENHVFPQVGKVTVSIGITEIRDTSFPVELLGHADQALYYAKTHGRNRVAFYEGLLANGEIDAYRRTAKA